MNLQKIPKSNDMHSQSQSDYLSWKALNLLAPDPYLLVADWGQAGLPLVRP